MSTEIKKTVEIDIKSNAEGSIGQLKDLKKQLKLVAAGSEEFKTLYNQIDDLEDKIKSGKKASADWVDSLEQAGGPLGAVGAALNRAKVATQSFGGALKATGIGLVIALVAGLVGAFSENEKAMKKLQPLLIGLQKIFGGIFAAVEPLFNYLVDVAVQALPVVTKGIGLFYSAVFGLFTFVKEAGMGYLKVWKGILTLDFSMAKAGVMQMKDSFAIAVKAGEDTYKKFEEGTKGQTKIEKEELEKREAAAKAAQEKKDAADKLAKEKAAKKAEENQKSFDKDFDEMVADQLRRQAVQDEIDATRKRNEDALKTEQQLAIDAENKAYEDKLYNQTKYLTDKDEIKKVEQELEIEHWNKINDINKTAQNKLDATDKEHREKTAEEKEKELANAKIVANAKVEIEADAINAIGGLTGLAKSFGEQNKGIQKGALIAENAVGIAKIIVNTNQANALALANPANELSFGAYAAAKIPLNWASAGIGIASSIAATAKGLQALGGGDASGGGAAGGAAGGGTAPQAQFNVVGASGTNQLAATIGRNQNQPIKAYVVGSDVTNQQSLDRARLNSATFL